MIIIYLVFKPSFTTVTNTQIYKTRSQVNYSTHDIIGKPGKIILKTKISLTHIYLPTDINENKLL